MKVEIIVTEDDGSVNKYISSGSLRQAIWDGLLTAKYQDEQWRDIDTCDSIEKKLKGEIPIEFKTEKNQIL